MQQQATRQEPNYKMSRLDEYRLWAMICDSELNAELKAKGQSLMAMAGNQAAGISEWLSSRRARVAN